MTPVRQHEDTRTKILETALDLFHRGSYKGTSIHSIVEQAGITKGALFHYFKGKDELGYAVVDECIRMHIMETWVDPITDISAVLDRLNAMLVESPEMFECGCPLNNLAQEMSGQDENFRTRLLELYQIWEAALEKAFRAGIDAGNVKADVNPTSTAATIVALLEGGIGMIKVNQNMEHLEKITLGFRSFLETLKP